MTLKSQPHLVGPKAVARNPGPAGGFLVLLDPLLRCPALNMEVTTARFVPVSVVTMKPTRGKSAPR
jgi:hypothetical protein